MGSGMGEQVPIIEARRLVKWYGTNPALRGIDLGVASGEILVLFGPNGSGKTTLLRILAGRIRPTGGTARVAGHDVGAGGDSVRSLIGTLGHGYQLYEALSARENLVFAAAMLGVDRPRERILTVLARVGLEAVADARVRTFSSGMKRRLALAKLMLREPSVILLDEPYAGLDLEATKLLEEYLLASKAAGAAAILATHNLTKGFAVADRLAILGHGRLVFEGRREDTSVEALRDLFALHGEVPEIV
jgi:heme ABC exporter ATP-binding subunit CcmA